MIISENNDENINRNSLTKNVYLANNYDNSNNSIYLKMDNHNKIDRVNINSNSLERHVSYNENNKFANKEIEKEINNKYVNGSTKNYGCHGKIPRNKSQAAKLSIGNEIKEINNNSNINNSGKNMIVINSQENPTFINFLNPIKI